MGMKDWLDKAKKIAQEQLTPEPTDPEAVRKKKKADAEKTFKMTTDAIKLAKKGMDGYKAASDKIDALTDAAAEKTLVIADKAKPLADKVDGAFDAASDKAKGAFDFVKDKVSDGARAVTDGAKAVGNKVGNKSGEPKVKPEATPKPSSNKPSTGSSLLDFLSPAVPETDATKPKKPTDTPKP